MKVVAQWIVLYDNQPQLMVYCGKRSYFITETGAFNQRPMKWLNIHSSVAEALIENKEEIPKED